MKKIVVNKKIAKRVAELSERYSAISLTIEDLCVAKRTASRSMWELIYSCHPEAKASAWNYHCKSNTIQKVAEEEEEE